MSQHDPAAPVEGPRGDAPPRRPYVAPAVEPLGPWQALTLQQSVPLTGSLIVRAITGLG